MMKGLEMDWKCGHAGACGGRVVASGVLGGRAEIEKSDRYWWLVLSSASRHDGGFVDLDKPPYPNIFICKTSLCLKLSIS
jgi:hypothetical protein